MNYLNSILFSILFLFTTQIFGQTELENSFPSFSATQVYVDHLGNIYLVSDANVYKTDRYGKKLFEYNNPGLGKVTYINVFNPLNILVFYEESNQYVFLDNRLNPNLNNFVPANSGYFDVQLTATKDQNNIWFYDQVNDKIHLWSLTRNVVLSSSLQVRQLAFNNARPNYIYATIKNVYLNIPDVGIIVFDNFGSYEKSIPITNLKKFALTESGIIFEKDGLIEQFNLFTKESVIHKIPDDSYSDISFYNDRIILLKKDIIKIYKISKN